MLNCNTITKQITAFTRAPASSGMVATFVQSWAYLCLFVCLFGFFFHGQLPNDADVGVIASISKPLEGGPFFDWELSVIFYNSNDTSNRTSVANVNLSVHDLPLRQDLRYVLYKVDNTNGNPNSVWKDMGSPVFPTDEQFQELRKHQASNWGVEYIF